jgi:hypothetical protein
LAQQWREPEVDMTESCATCRYFKIIQPEEGICRRYPPTPIVMTDIQMQLTPQGPQPQSINKQGSLFPVLSAKDGWCGEHTIKPVDLH